MPENKLNEDVILENILRSSTDMAIAATDLDFRILYYNQVAENMFGYRAEEIIGKTVMEVHTKEHVDPSRFERAIELVRKQGKYQYILEQKKEDGIRFIESTVSGIWDRQNNLIGFVLMSQDITSRKKAEYELLKAKDRLSKAQEVAHMGNWDWDIMKNTLLWSDEIYRIFGLKTREFGLTYEAFLSLVHPYDREFVMQSVNEALYGNKPYSIDHCIILPDGSKRIVHEQAEVFFDAEGKPVRMVGTIQDITERKQSDDALRLSEEKFSKAFRSSPTFITICTLNDDRFVDVNDAFLNASGYSREEVIGRSSDELGIWVDPVDRGKMADRLREQGIVNNQEVKFRVKSGNVLSALWSAEMIDIEGEPCVLAVILDITERKKLESQLLHSQKMEAVGQLAGGVAHDFNNILSAIMSYGYLLRNKLRDDEHSRDNVDKILLLSDRAAHIIRGLLAFSRKQHFEFVPVKLNDTIRNIEKLLAKFVAEDVRLCINLTNKEPAIIADRSQIEQIIMNLATNARDAMPDGGSFTIETEVVEIDENFIKSYGYGEPGIYALLSVTDTGTGMDEETKQKIFEPFFTTKEVGKGTGLGLSIIYGIVKQHNGYINVYSEPGTGATFRIYFPIIKAAAEKEKAKNLPDLTGKAEAILLAEDEPAVRDSISKILEEFGYKVIEAEDGEDAVEKFTDNKDEIQLLILDIVMPRKNGKETFEEIRKLKPEIKVLFTSG
ncbi:MAG TPA: PAS domain S-box protein, partial [Nitrospirae bacterium]|nr:PAS domain S-box protein [Nitrospirota bacterium]